MIEYLKLVILQMDIEFPIQLIIVESLFFFKKERKKLFPLRVIASIIICLFASFIWYRDISTPLGIFLGVLKYLVIFALTLVCFYFCFDCSFSELLFFGIGAYAIQHLAYALHMLIILSFAWSMISISMPVYYVIGAACMTGTYTLCYFIFVKKIRSGRINIVRPRFIIPSALLVLTSVIMNLYWFSKWDVKAIYEVYPIVSCVMALFILSGMFENSKLEKENEIMRYMLEQKRDQFELSKENITAINMKCHDMKHQLTALLSRHIDIGDYAEDIERTVDIYDSIAKTGNEALDVILTEKGLYCEANNINFTYIANGDLLLFMSATDIYSLFGNALDNAIESVKKLEEKAKRIIGMTLTSTDKIITIHFENYYGDDLTFENGLPKTTKAEKEFHGLGLKSIAMIAEKYGGTMAITTQNEIFNLNIVLPVIK